MTAEGMASNTDRDERFDATPYGEGCAVARGGRGEGVLLLRR